MIYLNKNWMFLWTKAISFLERMRIFHTHHAVTHISKHSYNGFVLSMWKNGTFLPRYFCSPGWLIEVWWGHNTISVATDLNCDFNMLRALSVGHFRILCTFSKFFFVHMHEGDKSVSLEFTNIFFFSFGIRMNRTFKDACVNPTHRQFCISFNNGKFSISINEWATELRQKCLFHALLVFFGASVYVLVYWDCVILNQFSFGIYVVWASVIQTFKLDAAYYSNTVFIYWTCYSLVDVEHPSNNND